MLMTLIIVIVTAVISLIALNNQKFKADLIFWPSVIQSNGQYYRFLSYGFIHADLIHLSFNMISLYSFGVFIERDIFSAPWLFGDNGRWYFLAMYILALIVATIPDYFKYRNTYGYTALGASGAVSAVIFSGIILQPTMEINFMFIPFPIKGYIFGILFLAMSWYLAKKGKDNIGHVAHFFGALFGVAFTVIAGKLFANEKVDLLSQFIHSVFKH
ncbi:MAG: rhomboid family intramembrane serine protease [Bacteroidetes bacterium]|nr:MAG: rhomboid family intramembrane serine protease [Bacteroidota bacterium]